MAYPVQSPTAERNLPAHILVEFLDYLRARGGSSLTFRLVVEPPDGVQFGPILFDSELLRQAASLPSFRWEDKRPTLESAIAARNQELRGMTVAATDMEGDPLTGTQAPHPTNQPEQAPQSAERDRAVEIARRVVRGVGFDCQPADVRVLAAQLLRALGLPG